MGDRWIIVDNYIDAIDDYRKWYASGADMSDSYTLGILDGLNIAREILRGDIVVPTK